MAYTLNADTDLRAYPTVGDQSGNQYRAMVLGANGIALATTLGEFIDGVLTDDPPLGTNGTIQLRNVAKVLCGGAFAVGDDLMVDAAGEFVLAVAAAGANAIIAKAVTAGVDGALASVELGYRGSI